MQNMHIYICMIFVNSRSGSKPNADGLQEVTPNPKSCLRGSRYISVYM